MIDRKRFVRDGLHLVRVEVREHLLDAIEKAMDGRRIDDAFRLAMGLVTEVISASRDPDNPPPQLSSLHERLVVELDPKKFVIESDWHGSAVHEIRIRARTS